MTDTIASPPKLRLLFWETTVRCNLSCAHCRRLETNDAAPYDFTTEQGLDLIRALAALGASQGHMPILVFSGGEPLCREDLFEWVAYARRFTIPCALATNGTLIDAAMAARIAANGLSRTAISLDGATAAVHDGLRRLPGAFDQAIAGITHLREHKVPFQINMTLTQSNVRQLDAMHTLSKSLGAEALHLFVLVPVGCGETLTQDQRLSPEQTERAMHAIGQLESRGDLPIKVTCGPHYERIKRERGLTASRGSHPGGVSRGCLAGLGVLFVGHRGEVFPCGYLPVSCGNVRKDSLSTIWRENKDLALMRDSQKLQGKCGMCQYRTLCGGCRARAYHASGSYMAQDPLCHYSPCADKTPAKN